MVKNKAFYILIGIVITVSGSLLAASTNLPYQFSAGGKAKASEVNANFNTLISAVNGIDGRITSLEQANGQTTPIRFTVNQNDLQVGSVITIGGFSYTIVQFEIPRFDSDEIYLLKYPSRSNFTSGNSSDNVYVSGNLHDTSIADQITSLNGFDTLIFKNYSFNSTLNTSASGRTVSSYYSQNIYTRILLGTQTEPVHDN